MKIKSMIIKISVPLVSIMVAFCIGGIIILCLGKNPITAYGFLFSGAFGSNQKIAQTLEIACPLIFTGLAASFAYKCGIFNLGGEGQFIMGAISSIFISTQVNLNGVPLIIISLIGGIIMGGLWGMIPGILKVTRGINEMIVSIMLNYVAVLFMGCVYSDILRDGSVPQTVAVSKDLRLAELSSNLKVHYGFCIAVVIAVILYYFIFYTSTGFKLRAVGINSIAAKYNGYAVNKIIMFSFICSGAIAGLGGSIELHGKQFRLMSGFGSGFGFDGVAIALIAQLNPIATLFIAIFFALLRKGANSLQIGTGVPTSVVDIIQALIIVFAVAGTAFVKIPSIKQYFLRLNSKKKGGVDDGINI